MVRKGVLLVFACVLVALLVGLVGKAAAPEVVSLPKAISQDSACPVVGCASETCHSYDDVPQPDGVHVMACPDNGCESSDCHAWESIENGYKRANDASLNIWILAPVLLLVGFVVLVKRMR